MKVSGFEFFSFVFSPETRNHKLETYSPPNNRVSVRISFAAT